MNPDKKTRGKNWTKEEDIQVLKAINNRGYLTITETTHKLAKILERTAPAIQARYNLLVRKSVENKEIYKEALKSNNQTTITEDTNNSVIVRKPKTINVADILFRKLTQKQKDELLKEFLGLI